MFFCEYLFNLFAKHSAITAYPLYFTLLYRYCLSVFTFITIQNRAVINILLGLHFLGMATLFYEVFLIYQLLFLVLLCFRFPPIFLNQKEKRKQFIKSWAPYLIVGILYLVVYAAYYFSQERGYDGNQISNALNWAEMGKTLWRLSSNSLPLAPF